MNEHAGEITALTLALMPLCHLTEPQTDEEKRALKRSATGTGKMLRHG